MCLPLDGSRRQSRRFRDTTSTPPTPRRMPQVHSEASAANGADNEARPHRFWALTLGSMGVVFGDIGTSPLYAFRVALQAAADQRNIVTQRRRARRAVADPVGADPRRHLQICVDPARADNKGEGGTLSLMALAQGRSARARIRYTMLLLGMIAAALVLRRCADHARHLGAVGGRRLGGRRAAAARICGAADGDHPGRPVRRPIARHGPGRGLLRSGDDALVHLHCRGRPRAHRRRTRGCSLLQPVPRACGFLASHGIIGLRDARRRVPCRHRRRGALCRSRPFRPKADPDGMALFRAAGAHPELFRPGRARAGRPDGDRQPVLPHGAVLGALSHDRARHRGHRRSRARRSSPAPSRSPIRRCSSASCPACRSGAPRRRRPGKSTSRASMPCC